MSQAPIYFCFANPRGFSGQKAATQLIMTGLTQRGWTCRALPQPVRERENAAGAGELLRYAGSLLGSWGRSLGLLSAGNSWLHLNMGQTRVSFLRDGVPLLFATLGLGRGRIVISLHGSLFMNWPAGSLNARIFSFLLNRAGTVTVLGRQQQARLLAMGVNAERVKILPNTCELAPLDAPATADKHAPGRSGPVRLLYLSSLIDTKGYPEYLSALRRLAATPGPGIEAVLCGRIVLSEFAGRFATVVQAAAWIEEQIAAINAGSRVRARWVKGAVGAAKEALFYETDIFVLPTRYPVEAQPIVLLEAMASACAIVTTRVGEIETILNDTCAVFLPSPTTAAVIAAVDRLLAHPEERVRLGAAAANRFREQYAPDKHLDEWERIFSQSENP